MTYRLETHTFGPELEALWARCSEFNGFNPKDNLSYSYEVFAALTEFESEYLDEVAVQVWFDESENVVAIFQFVRAYIHTFADCKHLQHWQLIGEDNVLDFHFMCKPELLHLFALHWPVYCSESISVDYVGIDKSIACTFDHLALKLHPTMDEYMASLSHKARGNLRRVQRANELPEVDAEIEYSNTFEFDAEVTALLHEYEEYWFQKDRTQALMGELELFDESSFSGFYIKQAFILAKDAEKYDNLVVMKVREQGKLIAINIAVKQGTTLCDYLCLRNMSEDYLKRSLGILCVLKTIEYAIANNFVYYDIGTGAQTYKAIFRNHLMQAPGVCVLSDVTLFKYSQNKGYNLPLIYDGRIIETDAQYRQELLGVSEERRAHVVRQTKRTDEPFSLDDLRVIGETHSV